MIESRSLKKLVTIIIMTNNKNIGNSSLTIIINNK